MLVHGDLVVTVLSAEDLRHGETWGLGKLGKVMSKVAGDHNDPHVDLCLFNGAPPIASPALAAGLHTVVSGARSPAAARCPARPPHDPTRLGAHRGDHQLASWLAAAELQSTLRARAGDKLMQTRSLLNEKMPVWNERFSVPLCHEMNSFTFEVKDRDVAGSTPLGDVEVQLAPFMASPGACTTLTLARPARLVLPTRARG